MNICFEQNGPTLNGVAYPKAISSPGDKSILGEYLRDRLGVSYDTQIDLDDLLDYGRVDIDIKTSSHPDFDFEINFDPFN